MTWEEVVAHALALGDTELATHYGQPAIKARGRAMLGRGTEPGSFVLHLDEDSKRLLIETDPATFWQTPHYAGWPALLVRLDTADPERVLAMVERAREQALARARPRRR